jgi:hypothetical protein
LVGDSSARLKVVPFPALFRTRRRGFGSFMSVEVFT